MLASLDVEHEVDQGAFEPRAGAVENRETRGSDLCRAFEIENAECRTEINVVLRFEIKLRRRAPATHFLVCRFVIANRQAMRYDAAR